MRIARSLLAAALLVGSSLALSAGAPRPASAATTFEGDYATDCQKAQFQCWWTFEKRKGGVYGAVFYVADRLDSTKVRCSFGGEGKVKAGRLELKMGRGGYRIVIAEKGQGLNASTPESWRDDCIGANMFGRLDFIGDY